jgi:hypothetical protein
VIGDADGDQIVAFGQQPFMFFGVFHLSLPLQMAGELRRDQRLKLAATKGSA